MTIDEERRTDRQLMDDGLNLGEAFQELDMAMLAKLTPEERAIQHKLRFDLHMYVDRVWDEPQHTTGTHPVDAGGYGSAGGLKDLLCTLFTNVEEAQAAAGDSEGYQVKVTVEQIE